MTDSYDAPSVAAAPTPPRSDTGLGVATPRVEGFDKVTGATRYAGELAGDPSRDRSDGSDLPKGEAVRYAYLVTAEIPAGRIVTFRTDAAEQTPGVLMVLTHRNCPPLESVDIFPRGPAGTSRMPLQEDRVRYEGEPIAVVVADTFETARYAAALVEATFDADPPRPFSVVATDAAGGEELPDAMAEMLNESRGDAETAIDAASDSGVVVDEVFRTPAHAHNPLELGVATATWRDGSLTMYDSTQWVLGVRHTLAKTMGLPLDRVRVLAPATGGGFGCKCFCWPHEILAAVAARELAARGLGQTVRLALTRPQTFHLYGPRPATVQQVTLAASADGRLQAIRHRTLSQTSAADRFCRNGAELSLALYDCPDATGVNRVALVQRTTPTNMRAPAESYGSFALESAIDELAARLKLDPLRWRLDNVAREGHPSDIPWSSFRLPDCLVAAAEAFGWADRHRQPRAVGEGRVRGSGIAAAAYGAYRSQAAVRVRISAEGIVEAASATQEIGSGTTTLIAQAVAGVFDMAPANVRVRLGDTDLPAAPVHGASRNANSVTPAAVKAARSAAARLAEAVDLEGKSWENGRLAGRALAELAAEAGGIEVIERADPDGLGDDDFRTLGTGLNTIRQPSAGGRSRYAFGAHCVEVEVDTRTRTIRVLRVVTRVAAGRILNPLGAHSQVLGGVVMGVSQTLLEGLRDDPATGRMLTQHPLTYPFAELGQSPPVDIAFLPDDDPHLGGVGAKGVSEIGLVGIAAAIANAVFDATGERLRSLPLRLPLP